MSTWLEIPLFSVLPDIPTHLLAELAEELAEIQNNIHGVGNSSGESDKCAKLTKSCEY